MMRITETSRYVEGNGKGWGVGVPYDGNSIPQKRTWLGDVIEMKGDIRVREGDVSGRDGDVIDYDGNNIPQKRTWLGPTAVRSLCSSTKQCFDELHHALTRGSRHCTPGRAQWSAAGGLEYL